MNMHTVFVNDRPFRFVNAYEADEWKGNSGSLFLAEQEMTVMDALHELEETPLHPGFIYLTSNPDAAWHLFISYCTLVEAAGGLVVNENQETLVIFRKGKYDLPKGKLDYEESPEQCAIREIEEECGIRHLEIIRPLEKTFHTYQYQQKRFLKKTHWFLMKTLSQVPVPQAEEDIEKAEWMTEAELKSIFLKNTYASIESLLWKYLKTKA